MVSIQEIDMSKMDQRMYVCLFTGGHPRHDASDFMDSVYRRPAPTARSARGAVFEGVLIERKKDEAAIDAAVFKSRGVIVKGIKCESSFESSSGRVELLDVFHHTDG
jgi:hypothetical protein